MVVGKVLGLFDLTKHTQFPFDWNSMNMAFFFLSNVVTKYSFMLLHYLLTPMVIIDLFNLIATLLGLSFSNRPVFRLYCWFLYFVLSFLRQ